MNGLYATSREALAEGIKSPDANGSVWLAADRHAQHLADHLIDAGVVRVIDPDDDALVERLGEVILAETPASLALARKTARAVLRALTEDQVMKE